MVSLWYYEEIGTRFQQTQMYPEDRVLITYLPDPADFELLQNKGWYRIPEKHAPKGLYAEYYAFYFGRKFGDKKWAIHYFARQQGYELVQRLDLFPEQADHPRAQDYYYKVVLGPLQKLSEPIVSLNWRRITFIHTTWDRFQDAREINDLLIEGGEYVDRIYAALKERGFRVERNYRTREQPFAYSTPLIIRCRNGIVDITRNEIDESIQDPQNLIDDVVERVALQGGSV